MQVHQDLPHERLEWKLERVGWVVMALALLAALAGLLGPGPLSRATAGQDGSPLWVQYNRLARYQAPESLQVHIGPGAARGGTIRVWLSREYVRNMELNNIDPEPESVEVGPERSTYTFNLSDSDQPSILMFRFEANRFGKMPAALGLEGGPQVAFTQFIYP
ncbi:MAG TPA: hypothetical protein VFF69_11455 [Phycisphaerales bacterium]|nr:hypothetical protein [Phycisphaerales bacterium]